MSKPEHNPAAAVGIDDEIVEYSDDFKCCVCLDLIYKPVVLACGHISCFWCVFEAMDIWQESRCPVCRHSYYHFPSICWLLHSVLLKLYPTAYKIREIQVTKVEKTHGTSSPQFENYLAASQCHTMEPVHSENNGTKDVDVAGTCTSGSDHVERCNKQISINDLLCSICKELLCRPVVLNCGHVFCEACIAVSNESCRCPVCQSMHPNGFPKVCLVLEGLLKQHFSEEYTARIDKFRTCEPGNSSTADSTSFSQGSKCSSVPMDEHLCSSGHKVHFGVGCDCCGMYPLMGNRYKCNDCTEEVGFDLCENCHNSSSTLPGRFNQQHKPDHKFEVIEPNPIIILSGDFPEDYDPDHLENQTDDSTAPDLSLDTQQDPEGDVAGPEHSENQTDDITSVELCLHAQQDSEGDVAGHGHANDASGGNDGLGPTL
ncbi:E3 ubiquitin-protein ligase PRT1-like [Bidens hawaiensis]|uniref:E3 ubiquitin-protein ligase PRT1-like n=1 Tax=Bidens hawaiensis TaxID=980011 RepID=UPI004049BF0D